MILQVASGQYVQPQSRAVASELELEKILGGVRVGRNVQLLLWPQFKMLNNLLVLSV